MGLLMAAIVAGTVLGMVYLTQTLGSNAASTEVYRLEAARNSLITEIRRHEVVALEMTQAETIVTAAQEQKLKRLGEPIILSAP